MNLIGVSLCPVLLAALVAVILIPSLGWAEELEIPATKNRSLEELKLVMDDVLADWSQRDIKAWGDLEALKDEMIANFTKDEVRLAAEMDGELFFTRQLFKRWATLDHEEVFGRILTIQGMSEEYNDRYEAPGSFYVFIGAFEGWALKEPRKAWAALQNTEELELGSYRVVKDYRPYFLQIGMRELARKDPEFALQEFFKEKYAYWEIRHMLNGFFEGVPAGRRS